MTHFSVNVRGPWSTVGLDGRVSLFPDNGPKLLRSLCNLEIDSAPSPSHTPTDALLRGDGLPTGVTGERKLEDLVWSLVKYEMEDCRLGFPSLKVRPEGDGVESPSAEERGDVNAEAESGEFDTAGMLLSNNCSGRGGPLGELSGDVDAAVIVLVLISCKVTLLWMWRVRG